MFSRLRSFLTAWTRRERFEDSLDEEVRFHLDAYAEDLIRSGLPRREALRRARIHFGSVEGMKDDCRQARGLRLADEISRDIKHAGRSLRRDPGFGMVAVATLGLSIGATVLVFSIIDAWLFRPLSFPEPDRLTAMVLGSALEAVLYGVRPGRPRVVHGCARSPADRCHRRGLRRRVAGHSHQSRRCASRQLTSFGHRAPCSAAGLTHVTTTEWAYYRRPSMPPSSGRRGERTRGGRDGGRSVEWRPGMAMSLVVELEPIPR